MSGDLDTCLEAALWFAMRGWPVLPIKPQSKEPLSRRGVTDATVDSAQIEQWFSKWPNANVGIACGTPGPQVLDIDDPKAGHAALVSASRFSGPDVATARGRQFYLAGSSAGTIGLGWGELRGTGSYVVAPPSIHPSGKLYVFLIRPTMAPLPAIPDDIVPDGRGTAGTGTMDLPDLIPYGQRHEALKDAAIRFVRSGITDVNTLEHMLRAFFEARFVPTPKPRKDAFLNHATWAARSNIAQRERAYADFDETKPAKSAKKATGLENAPRGDAPLKEHRQYVRIAGGWGDRIDIETVRRAGAHADDGIEIRLTNGQIIAFAHQENVAKRGHWARMVTLATSGIADPIYLNDLAGAKVLRSLCILAETPAYIDDAEELAGRGRRLRPRRRARRLPRPDGGGRALRGDRPLPRTRHLGPAPRRRRAPLDPAHLPRRQREVRARRRAAQLPQRPGPGRRLVAAPRAHGHDRL
jgi:hypothetical protein